MNKKEQAMYIIQATSPDNNRSYELGPEFSN